MPTRKSWFLCHEFMDALKRAIKDMYIDHLETPIGLITIEANNHALTVIKFIHEIPILNPNKITEQCKKQLSEYFASQRKSFDLPFELDGTDFQKTVWSELLHLNFGDTCSYSDVAIAIGNPRAQRAVGNANGKNLLPIIIPCHRVIANDGGLGGYACGLDKKAWLLKHEGSFEH